MKILASLITLGFSGAAAAHHPLNGMPMETFGHGVLSGIGHPLLGSDHLAFIILVGLVSFAFIGRKRFTVPAVFAGGSLVGLIAGYAGLAGSFVEPGVMLSILLLGVCVASGWAKKLSFRSLLATICLSGGLHGIAFSGALIGVETTSVAVLGGYWLGLGGTLLALSVIAGYVCAGMGRVRYSLDEIRPKLIGAALAGVGAFIIFEELEGVALTMAGLA